MFTENLKNVAAWRRKAVFSRAREKNLLIKRKSLLSRSDPEPSSGLSVVKIFFCERIVEAINH